MTHQKDDILGFHIPGTTEKRVLESVQKFWSNSSVKPGKTTTILVTTPNPEILLLAQSDNNYRKIISHSSLNIPDGIGLAIARKLENIDLGPYIPTFLARLAYLPFLYIASIFTTEWLTKDFKIIHGRKVFLKIVNLAHKDRRRIYLYGGRGDSVEKTIEHLKTSYKGVKIKGKAGAEYDINAIAKSMKDKNRDQEVIAEISKYKPDILFVGIEPPKQEKWIWNNRHSLNAKLAMGVGGTFDYLSGKVPVPPEKIEKMELEWLWRLVTQPKRIKRIVRVSVIFPLKVIFQKT